MSREEFDRLVARIEGDLGRRPRALERRVVWLALGVYLTLFASFLVVSAVVISLAWIAWNGQWSHGIFFWIGALIILGGGGWSMLRVLWVRTTPPEGREVTPAEAPALFSLVEELRAQVQAPPFDRVLIDARCNAAVVQQARLGVLGWHRYLLMLGLPLLEGLSPDEARAVLAHELAHLSRNHGRTGRWIYYLRRSWENAFEQLRKPRGQGAVSLRSWMLDLVNWFWPRFNAHAFVLSRNNEYEADAVGVRLTSAWQMGAALVRQDMVDRHLEQRFWPDFWQLANHQESPPLDVLDRMRVALRAGPSEAERARWAEQAFLSATTNADTHPCLRERIAAFGSPPVLTEADAPALAMAPAASAADALLGQALPAIRADLERRWREEHQTAWRERHAKVGVLQHQLSRIEEAAPVHTSGVDVLWDKTQVLLHLQDGQGAEPLLRQILQLAPAHVGANFHLGRLLLTEAQGQGEIYLERAMAEDEECVPAACGLLHGYFRETGQTERIRQLGIRLDRHEQTIKASRLERTSVSAKDPLIAHGLGPVELEALRAVLAQERALTGAFLVQKELRHFPKQRLYLLCVCARRAWHLMPDRAADQALVQQLSGTLPLRGRVLVMARSGGFRALARRVAAQPGAQIFDAAAHLALGTSAPAH